jgi:hypothetical protein
LDLYVVELELGYGMSESKLEEPRPPPVLLGGACFFPKIPFIPVEKISNGIKGPSVVGYLKRD